MKVETALRGSINMISTKYLFVALNGLGENGITLAMADHTGLTEGNF
jgi:hypothetical protein